ncbi:MAG TPA: PQQ-binding-like beta-propeller repeat protein [Acidimicrobiales bacterium]|nr:PQQ-binding-like beta-propeller repeat protein [Acidimicrobiales bacterium]
MRKFRPRRSACCLVLVAGGVVAACGTPTASNQPIATYHGDNARAGYSARSSLTPANAPLLKQKWDISDTSTISAQAIVADDSVYWGDWNGIEHATSTSGKTLWSTSVGRAPKPRSCPFPLGDLGVTSSATVGNGGGQTTVWVGGGGGNLYALNASTGAVLWRTQLGAPPENVLWSSPALYDGSIYQGIASWNDCPGVVYGKLFRVNAATGAIQGVFSPEKGRCVGGGIWTSPTIDTKENAVFVTTGNDACDSSLQNSIFKLNATTMAVESRWQTPKNSLVTDADFGATPTLFTGSIGGSTRQLIGAEAKDGVYYTFDRNDLSAGPIWTYVVQNDTALSSNVCLDRNSISSSAWAGPGAPVMVAGLAVRGSECIGTLTALDPATGTPEWQVPLQGGVVQGPVTEGPGLVAVGAGTSLEILSSATGSVLFSYAEPQSGHDSGNGYGEPYWFWAPATLAGNSLYIGNQDGNLRAFAP